MAVFEGSIIVIQCKAARKEVDTGLRRLAQAAHMVESDPEIMHGLPVYRGTRIPVQAIAGMLSGGVTVAEILEGYPALTAEKVQLAPMYVKAFPRKGRPIMQPWSKRKPTRRSEQRVAS